MDMYTLCHIHHHANNRNTVTLEPYNRGVGAVAAVAALAATLFEIIP